jgi:hypothetical protein
MGGLLGCYKLQDVADGNVLEDATLSRRTLNPRR